MVRCHLCNRSYRIRRRLAVGVLYSWPCHCGARAFASVAPPEPVPEVLRADTGVVEVRQPPRLFMRRRPVAVLRLGGPPADSLHGAVRDVAVRLPAHARERAGE